MVTFLQAVTYKVLTCMNFLVKQAETRIKNPQKYSELVDPLLKGNYPKADLSQVLAIAAMCLSNDASVRPSMSDVVAAFASLMQDPIHQ